MKNNLRTPITTTKEPTFTVGSWLIAARHKLETSGIPTPDLDAQLLIGDYLDKNRAWVLAHPEFELTVAQVDALQKKLDRRAEHEPMAYIRQKIEFYGREFYVNKNVLVPRPESETMIEMALELAAASVTGMGIATVKGVNMEIGTGTGVVMAAGTEASDFSAMPSYLHDGMKVNDKNTPAIAIAHSSSDDVYSGGASAGAIGSNAGGGGCNDDGNSGDDSTASLPVSTSPSSIAIADVGSGSGALGITVALELAVAGIKVDRLILSDIDPLCLAVAKRNSRTYKLHSQFHETNLIENVGYVDIILANLPYVPDDHTINQAAMTEPKHAIFGGADGLDLYRELFTQLESARTTWQPKLVLTESLPFQHEGLAALAASHGFTLAKTDDFIQAFTPA